MSQIVASSGKSEGFACFELKEPLKKHTFDLNPLGKHDVELRITHSGVCHSDIHSVRGDWGPQALPLVVGHEMLGKVTQVGSEVKKFKVGQTVGVGPQALSCMSCGMCSSSHENYCTGPGGFVGSYGAKLPAAEGKEPFVTQGGYSQYNRTHERFVIPIPDGMDPNTTAPLLCAGVTIWTPLKYAGVTKGTKVGVIGLGGLGHLAVKFAHYLGAEVTMISTSANKQADAEKLGADKFLLSTDSEQLAKYTYYFDVLLNSSSGSMDLNVFFKLLKPLVGKFMTVSGSAEAIKLNPFTQLFSGCTMQGTLIGSPQETFEMLEFCAKHKIGAEVEVFAAEKVNEVFEKVLKNEVRYRAVLTL